MSKSFLNKVAAERKVLSIVNQYTPGSQQLAGLSATAVEAWHHKLGAIPLTTVLKELQALSDSCQRLSDRSHETFGPLPPELEDTINIGLISLDNELRRAFNIDFEI